MGDDEDSMAQWEKSFRPAEIIIHYKWNRTSVKNNTKYVRQGELYRMAAQVAALDQDYLEVLTKPGIVKCLLLFASEMK